MPQLLVSVTVSALFAVSWFAADPGTTGQAPAIGVYEAWTLLGAGCLAVAWRALRTPAGA